MWIVWLRLVFDSVVELLEMVMMLCEILNVVLIMCFKCVMWWICFLVVLESVVLSCLDVVMRELVFLCMIWR